MTDYRKTMEAKADTWVAAKTPGASVRRTLERYARTSATAVAQCSPAHVQFFVEDAKADIATLAEALKLAAGALVQDDAPMIHARVHKVLADLERGA